MQHRLVSGAVVFNTVTSQRKGRWVWFRVGPFCVHCARSPCACVCSFRASSRSSKTFKVLETVTLNCQVSTPDCLCMSDLWSCKQMDVNRNSVIDWSWLRFPSYWLTIFFSFAFLLGQPGLQLSLIGSETVVHLLLLLQLLAQFHHSTVQLCAPKNTPPTKNTEQLGISRHLHHGSLQCAVRLCKRARVFPTVQHFTAGAAPCANRKEKITLMMPTARGGKCSSYSAELNHPIHFCCAFFSYDMSNWLQGKLRLPSKPSSNRFLIYLYLF